MLPINAKTRVCAVFGHPVGHSLSPELHNAAFAALELPYVYVAHDVEPGKVAAALEGVRVMGYRGLSVTIPHKIEALHAVDWVDETARGIGCINTVVNEDGRLLGYNSDGRGALDALRQAGADPTGSNVLMLGSGGVARAIAVTLACETPPSQLVILGVKPAEMAQLVADVQHCAAAQVVGHEMTESTLAQQMANADILLHCSPIGMHPKDDVSLVPTHLFRRQQVVFDVVYNPRRTKLLRDAAAAGCRTVEGIEMFLGQAVVQFELWTKRKAPVTIMRQVLEQRL